MKKACFFPWLASKRRESGVGIPESRLGGSRQFVPHMKLSTIEISAHCSKWSCIFSYLALKRARGEAEEIIWSGHASCCPVCCQPKPQSAARIPALPYHALSFSIVTSRLSHSTSPSPDIRSPRPQDICETTTTPYEALHAGCQTFTKQTFYNIHRRLWMRPFSCFQQPSS